MKTEDFFYDLPKELIAQEPAKKRDHSRLMILDKNTGEIFHKNFYDIVDELMPEDCLVLNDSRVLPARIFGKKKETGAIVEFLLLNKIAENIWETLAGPGKKAKPRDVFIFGDEVMRGEILNVKSDGNRIIKFFYNESNFFRF